jgi:hypothetical protein
MGPQSLDAPAPPEVTAEAAAFYGESLKLLTESGIPYMLAGTYALNFYTGVSRSTKDLDVFCKAGDYPRILAYFRARGYDTLVEDERWIAKVCRGAHFFDVIFNAAVGASPVNDQWFTHSRAACVYGTEVRIISPTDFIWSKAFLQDRYRYDGADIVHVILKQHEDIDWAWLLTCMEQHWEVLLMHVINFRFVYPSERDRVPRWLVEELACRLTDQLDLPTPQVRICRGRLLSPRDFEVDVHRWGFADVVGPSALDRGGPKA